MAAGGGLLISLESLGLGLGNRLVELGLTSLVDTTGLGIESTRVVTKSLELLVFGSASAFETNARLASALCTVISSLLRWDVLGVGASTSLTVAADGD